MHVKYILTQTYFTCCNESIHLDMQAPLLFYVHDLFVQVIHIVDILLFNNTAINILGLILREPQGSYIWYRFSSVGTRTPMSLFCAESIKQITGININRHVPCLHICQNIIIMLWFLFVWYFILSSICQR